MWLMFWIHVFKLKYVKLCFGELYDYFFFLVSCMIMTKHNYVSATMRITTICSLNAPILKRSGGMFVTDATFQE